MEQMTKEGRKQLRHLIDLVWNHIHGNESVPPTILADDLINKAFTVSEDVLLTQLIEDAKSLKMRLVSRQHFHHASNVRDIEKHYAEELAKLAETPKD